MQLTRAREKLVKSSEQPHAPFAKRSVEPVGRVTVVRGIDGNIIIVSIICNMAGDEHKQTNSTHGVATKNCCAPLRSYGPTTPPI